MSKNTNSRRNIVLCFDGTSNEFGANNTNIVKIYQALEKNEDSQIAFYDPGIGTMGPSLWARIFSEIHKIIAQITGRGISENIKQGYKYLMDNYQNGDRIYIFGFSRGAYTARSLGGMISRVGILDRGLDNQIDYAYKMYSDPRNHKFAEGFKSTYCRSCNVHLIGVFDTVGALMGQKLGMVLGVAMGALIGYFSFPFLVELVGISDIPSWILGLIGALLMMLPKNYLGRFFEKKILGSHHFHNTKLGASVSYGFHALAIDEKRWLFWPTRWDLSNTPPNQSIRQVWFSGVHVDAGGFNVENTSTSDNALAWMLIHSQDAGLKLNISVDKITKPSITHPLSKNGLLWSFLISVPRTFSNEDELHSSVEARIIKKDSYDVADSIPYKVDLLPKTNWIIHNIKKIGTWIYGFFST